ncbi:MAG: pyridoxine 5'-phosphate synthase [Candidatus Omnitrophica bacterium 4484_213]|nr:MAG: pyridoxine 5'-phosphate synthase [Candidatus Omnitrophica bacterium 4484_213]
MPKLCVNVDHIATLRQARRGREPDPVLGAGICERAGCEGIVVHLREDRRHIRERDVYLLKEDVRTKLNLEMSIAQDIVDIALDLRPDFATLVPERREEVTTEGGLDVLKEKERIEEVVARLQEKEIKVSLFIDPELEQIKVSKEIGADFIELHTGRYAHSEGKEQEKELKNLVIAKDKAIELGLKVNAGHGLNYQNVSPVAAISGIQELNIGHSIISRAVFVGLEKAVREMKEIITVGSRQ